MNAHHLRHLPLAELLLEVERIAREHYSGHYTILKFTTHYKICWGTPEMLSVPPSSDYDCVWRLPAFPTLRDALIGILANGYGDQRITYELTTQRKDFDDPEVRLLTERAKRQRG